jgi:methylthioribose-1-phosphate isomerase
MAIRGAPAIGVAAALGIALGVHNSGAEGAALRAEFDGICQELAGTRPTAVNLFWAIARMRRRFEAELLRGGVELALGDLEGVEALLRHGTGILGAARGGVKPGPRGTMDPMIPTVAWQDGEVVMIDQRLLPGEEVYLRCRDHSEVARAIRDMAIPGAPAIGVAAALGIALGVRNTREEGDALAAAFEGICREMAATRPTAVNLFWAIDRMRRRFQASRAQGGPALREALLQEAKAIEDEDLASCRRIGDLGADLLPPMARVLTHCNAGALATAGYGTALGVIRSAARQGKIRNVLADETRPYLQGARLTAWELGREGIPTTLIADNMAGHMMATGEVDAVVVGADRIAANGDVANKIGTYTVAVLARENGLPFYVAAPVSTIDLRTPSGDKIKIEERAPEEVTHHGGRRLAPEGVSVRNPAFDVTPHRYVTAIVCERGVARAPYSESLARLVGG